MAASAAPLNVGGQEVAPCSFCAYPVLRADDAVGFGDQIFHEPCFRCNWCGDLINSDAVALVDGRLYHPGPNRCEGLAKKRLCRCCGKFIPKSEAVAKGEGGDVFHADCFRCGICSLSLQNGWAPTDTWVQWDPFREQLPEFMPYVCDVCDESLAILQKALDSASGVVSSKLGYAETFGDQKDEDHEVATGKIPYTGPLSVDELEAEIVHGFVGRKVRVCDLTKKLPPIEGVEQGGSGLREELVLIDANSDLRVLTKAVLCVGCKRSLHKMDPEEEGGEYQQNLLALLGNPGKVNDVLRARWRCCHCDPALDPEQNAAITNQAPPSWAPLLPPPGKPRMVVDPAAAPAKQTRQTITKVDQDFALGQLGRYSDPAGFDDTVEMLEKQLVEVEQHYLKQ